MPEETNNLTSPAYSTPYRNMVMYIKSLYQDVTVLHHNVTGQTFFSSHEVLGQMYEKLGDMLDNLIELGMTIGLYEPSIAESLDYEPAIEVRFYPAVEAFQIIVDKYTRLIQLMENAKFLVPDDIKNKIEEHETTLRIDGLYKAQMFLA